MAPRPRLPILLLGTVLAALALIAGACSDDDTEADTSGADATTEPAAGEDDEPGANDSDDPEEGPALAASSTTYADPATWLCRPDVEGDACDIDLDATLVAADGTLTVEPFEPAADPPADCFYVYPTISTDEGENSDLVPGDAETGIAANQAARFAEVCRVFAPMYPQVPLGALFDNLGERDEEPEGETTTTEDPDDPDLPRNIAYSGVRESFAHYLAEDNDGRPFVLVGHSQGAGHLRRLISEEIDGDDALREQMLSAMLIGGSVSTEGDTAFADVAPCESPDDTSCVISYASFYAGEPPPEDSLFGAPWDGEGRVVCSNPGDLSNAGPAPLGSYFQAGHVEDAPAVETPWIHYDGLVEGECVSNEDFDWLELTNTAGADDARPADLGGRITPQWGTHLADVNFAIGDLVELVRSQSAA